MTLPLQLPIALVAVLFGLIFTATDMAVVYILTNGGPFNSTQVLTTWAFQTGNQGGPLGEGAAVSLFLLPVLAVVAIGMLLRATRGGRVRRRRWRQRMFAYGIVVLFAIVLAFPFYWMAMTALKPQGQLYDPRTCGTSTRRSRTSATSSTTPSYLRWLGNSLFVGLWSSRSPSPSRCRRATRSPASPGRVGGALASRSSSPTSSRRRSFPAAVTRDLGLGPPGPALVADPGLPVVHDPVRDLAADGLLQVDPSGARGRGADRRLLALRGPRRIVLPISVPGILTVVIFTFSLS